MTTPDTKVIKAQMEALSGFAPGPWKVSPTDDTTVITHDRNMVAEIDGDYNEPDLWPIMEANARLIAAAPDMRETILALCDALDELRADNERLRKAAGVVSAVLQSERARFGGQPFTGNWSIPQIGFRGTVDDALDMADAALAQEGDQP